MRAEAPTPIYTNGSFLSQYTPVSGNYKLPGMYDGIKDSLNRGAEKIRSLHSSTLDKVKDSYRSMKDLVMPKCELGFCYR